MWTDASNNFATLVSEHRDQVKTVLVTLFDLLASTSKGILLFMLAIIVSGVLLAYAKPAGELAKSLFIRIAGRHGDNMAEMAEITVRNVAKGILGIAVVQSLLAGVGLVIAGVPFAGLWILLCLILAIVQIGILPVSIGVIIYIWGSADTLTATLAHDMDGPGWRERQHIKTNHAWQRGTGTDADCISWRYRRVYVFRIYWFVYGCDYSFPWIQTIYWVVKGGNA